MKSTGAALLAFVVGAGISGCANCPRLGSADVSAVNSDTLVKAESLSEVDIRALENRCGIATDIAENSTGSGFLFRLDDCAITRPRHSSSYDGDAGEMKCGVLPLSSSNPRIDPARYNPAAILRLIAPHKGERICVVGSYQGLGQFYFYGLLPYEQRYKVTLR